MFEEGGSCGTVWSTVKKIKREKERRAHDALNRLTAMVPKYYGGSVGSSC